MMSDVLAGTMISAGNKSFGEMGNAREVARFTYGIEQLASFELIAEYSRRDHTLIYKVSERGYRLAEQIGLNLKVTKQIRGVIIRLGTRIANAVHRDNRSPVNRMDTRAPNLSAAGQPVKVVAVVSFDDKTTQDSRAEADRQFRVQNSLKNASWCAVIAASIYAAIAAYQAREMRRATLAAQQSASAAAAQLEATDRPWIKVIPQVSSPLTFHEGDLGFIVRFDLINVGRSVAASVWIDALGLVPAYSFPDTLVEKQRETCNRRFRGIPTTSVFPDETRQTSVGIAISREEMQKNGLQIQMPPPFRKRPGLAALPVRC